VNLNWSISNLYKTSEDRVKVNCQTDALYSNQVEEGIRVKLVHLRHYLKANQKIIAKKSK
jgi:hypothetical protein